MFNPERFSRSMIKSFGTTFSSADGTSFLGTEKDNHLFVALGTPINPGDILTRSCDQLPFLVIDRPINTQTHVEAPIREVRHSATVTRSAGGTRDAFGRTTGGTEIVYEDVPLVLDGDLRYQRTTEPDGQGATYVGTFLAPDSFIIHQGDILHLKGADSFRVVSSPSKRKGLQSMSVMQIS